MNLKENIEHFTLYYLALNEQTYLPSMMGDDYEPNSTCDMELFYELQAQIWHPIVENTDLNIQNCEIRYEINEAEDEIKLIIVDYNLSYIIKADTNLSNVAKMVESSIKLNDVIEKFNQSYVMIDDVTHMVSLDDDDDIENEGSDLNFIDEMHECILGQIQKRLPEHRYDILFSQYEASQLTNSVKIRFIEPGVTYTINQDTNFDDIASDIKQRLQPEQSNQPFINTENNIFADVFVKSYPFTQWQYSDVSKIESFITDKFDILITKYTTSEDIENLLLDVELFETTHQFAQWYYDEPNLTQTHVINDIFKYETKSEWIDSLINPDNTLRLSNDIIIKVGV